MLRVFQQRVGGVSVHIDGGRCRVDLQLVEHPVELAGLHRRDRDAGTLVEQFRQRVTVAGARVAGQPRGVVEKHWRVEQVLAEARARFDLCGAVCVHRIGDLAIGDMAVWVGVSAAHRGAAFDACRYIIDSIKDRVPIWKHERYVDGDAGWLHPERAPGGDAA